MFGGYGRGAQYYDPQPPRQIYPQETQYYRSCPAPVPVQPPAPPPVREVRVIYYDPNDPNFLPPAPPRPVPVALPAPKPSYVPMPSDANGFRPGDTYRVVAVEENKYSAHPPGGGYNDYSGGGGIRRVVHDPYYPY